MFPAIIYCRSYVLQCSALNRILVSEVGLCHWGGKTIQYNIMVELAKLEGEIPGHTALCMKQCSVVCTDQFKLNVGFISS